MAFKKNDVGEGKPDWSLFPFDGAEGIVRIMMMGAKKYSRDNWREGINDPDAQRRIFSATIRHLTALQRGETIDPESGEHHILHAATNTLFLAAFAETRRNERKVPDPLTSFSCTYDPSAVEDISGMAGRAEDCNHTEGFCRTSEGWDCNEVSETL